MHLSSRVFSREQWWGKARINVLVPLSNSWQTPATQFRQNLRPNAFLRIQQTRPYSLFSIPSPLPSLFYDRLSGPHVSTWWNYTGITYALMVFHHLLQLLIWLEPCNFEPTRIPFKTRRYTDAILRIIFVLVAVPILFIYIGRAISLLFVP